jgi:hypothetical protein
VNGAPDTTEKQESQVKEAETIEECIMDYSVIAEETAEEAARKCELK